MHDYQLKDIRNMKKQENMTSPKVHKNFPITDTKEMNGFELHEKEFKVFKEA